MLTGLTRMLSWCSYQTGHNISSLALALVAALELDGGLRTEAAANGRVETGAVRTSSRVFASTKIQPISMTSAESFVTYTPCSSQVVAT